MTEFTPRTDLIDSSRLFAELQDVDSRRYNELYDDVCDRLKGLDIDGSRERLFSSSVDGEWHYLYAGPYRRSLLNRDGQNVMVAGIRLIHNHEKRNLSVTNSAMDSIDVDEYLLYVDGRAMTRLSSSVGCYLGEDGDTNFSILPISGPLLVKLSDTLRVVSARYYYNSIYANAKLAADEVSHAASLDSVLQLFTKGTEDDIIKFEHFFANTA